MDAVEHVYELNWLSKFWTDLNVTGKLTCPTLTLQVLSLNKADRYAEKMQYAIGNTKNYWETMVLLPKKENSLKHRVGLSTFHTGLLLC